MFSHIFRSPTTRLIVAMLVALTLSVKGYALTEMHLADTKSCALSSQDCHEQAHHELVQLSESSNDHSNCQLNCELATSTAIPVSIASVLFPPKPVLSASVTTLPLWLPIPPDHPPPIR